MSARQHPHGLIRITGSVADRALHGSEASRRVEAHALALAPPHALMQRAGAAVARLALAVAPHAQRIAVLAGPGNNGGDGLVAALWLHRLGRRVQVVHLADPARLPADAADAWRQARDAGLSLRAEPGSFEPADLVIDALLGIGARRAPEAALAQAIAAIGAQHAPVLAVDLPSGLNADTGQRLGEACVRAEWTLSLLTLKPGLFTAQGRDQAGEVWLDDLGASASIVAEPATALLGAGVPDALPPRAHHLHKGSFGDLVVVGGARGMQGAARLAARAALNAGAGRVYLSALDAAAVAEDPAYPELMQLDQAWRAAPERLRASTVVCGCGGGDAVVATLPALLAQAGQLVLDADALNAIAARPELQGLLAARAGQGLPTVLTPHPLEAARLLDSDTATVQADRLRAAGEIARRFGSVVVLKGSGSVLARPHGAPCINGSGNALLATAGSGDVLAGWLGGVWAQQGRATGDDGSWRAARAAVWLHGHAADRVALQQGRRLPLRAARLIDAMRDAAA